MHIYEKLLILVHFFWMHTTLKRVGNQATIHMNKRRLILYNDYTKWNNVYNMCRDYIALIVFTLYALSLLRHMKLKRISLVD